MWCGQGDVVPRWCRRGHPGGNEQPHLPGQTSRTTEQQHHRGRDHPQLRRQDVLFLPGEDQKTEALMQSCIDANEEASCSNSINEALANGHVGEFIAEQGGPGVCSTVSWMCNGKQFSSKETFESSDCGAPSCGEPPDQRCLDPSYKNARICRAWASCMGY